MGTSEDARCVYCRRTTADAAFRPFCSERCRMADLGRWLTEEYRLPGAPLEPLAPPADGDDEASETRSR